MPGGAVATCALALPDAGAAAVAGTVVGGTAVGGTAVGWLVGAIKVIVGVALGRDTVGIAVDTCVGNTATAVMLGAAPPTGSKPASVGRTSVGGNGVVLIAGVPQPATRNMAQKARTVKRIRVIEFPYRKSRNEPFVIIISIGVPSSTCAIIRF